METPGVLIVGAGLAGLACALDLQARSIPFTILEASDEVGGRLRTDEHEGFLLDRGFQVYLTAYPEGQRLLNYGSLDFRTFHPGAMVRHSGQMMTISDPWRDRSRLWSTLFSPLAPLGDKLTIRKLRNRLTDVSIDQILAAPEMTTAALLQHEGFSSRMLDRFFRPFLGGIMLDSSLIPSRRMFEFVFKMMSEGDTVVPAKGIGQIPKQMAARLPAERIQLGRAAQAVTQNSVTLRSGEVVRGDAVVVACDGTEASRLVPSLPAPRWRMTTCVYYDAPVSPVTGPWLVLNGNAQWPVNHLAVMSEVAPEYAPPGRSLVSCSILGRGSQSVGDLDTAVKGQMERWFGSAVRDWRMLRCYQIPMAQPDVAPMPVAARPPLTEEGVYVAGDHRFMASSHFALLSGSLAAQEVAARLTGAAKA